MPRFQVPSVVKWYPKTRTSDSPNVRNAVFPNEILLRIIIYLTDDALFHLQTVSRVFLSSALDRRYQVLDGNKLGRIGFEMLVKRLGPSVCSRVRRLNISGFHFVSKKPPKWTRSLLSSMLHMTNVQDLAFCHSMKIPHSLFRTAWAAFGSRLQSLSLSMSFGQLASLGLAEISLPCLREFRFNSEAEIEYTTDECAIHLYTHLSPFLNWHKFTLEKLYLEFWYSVDLSSFFVSLQIFTVLQVFVLKGTYALKDPSCLVHFLHQHGGSLVQCEIVPVKINPSLFEAGFHEDRWLLADYFVLSLPTKRLKRLSLNVGVETKLSLFLWITSLVDTLESLSIAGCIMDFQEVKALSKILCHSTGKRVLRHLTIRIWDLTPILMAVLASNLRYLESLEIYYYEILDDESHIGWKSFVQGLRCYDLRSWKLQSIAVRQMRREGFQERVLQSSTFQYLTLHAALVSCIPSTSSNSSHLSLSQSSQATGISL